MSSSNYAPEVSTLPIMLALVLLACASRSATGQTLSFLQPRNISIGAACCTVLTGDFNKDGNADIAVANNTGGITVLLGDGKSGFTRLETGQGLPSGVKISALIAVADINSDGIPDLLALTATSTAGGLIPVPYGAGSVALLGVGDGSFRAPVSLGSGIVGAVADFNHDGRPDLLTFCVSVDCQSGFGVRLGNGDGTFQPLTGHQRYPDGDCCVTVTADFNGDGKPDIALSSFRSESRFVYVYLGNGDGTFGDVRMAPVNGSSTSSLAVGDFNRDGKPDLAVVINNLFFASLDILLGNGDGSFRPAVNYSIVENYPFGAYSLIAADFNGDGRLDLADGFQILLGNGDGTFQSPVAFGQYNSNSGLAALGDFNSDGKPDLVGPALDGTQLSVLINNTPRSDSSANAVSAATYTATVAPGSIAAIFGQNLAAATSSAARLPLRTMLGNTRVRILDQRGTEHLGQLIYVSPSQINFVVPQETAPGFAIFTIDGQATLVPGARSTRVTTVAPGLFSLNGTGKGPPAATAVRVQTDGKQTPVPIANCAGPCVPIPIDLAAGGTVFVSLYGTGFANATGASCDSSTSADFPAVTYIGPQRTYPGLDQLNLRMPKNLPSGQVTFTCYISGNLSEGFVTFTLLIK